MGLVNDLALPVGTTHVLLQHGDSIELDLVLNAGRTSEVHVRRVLVRGVTDGEEETEVDFLARAATAWKLLRSTVATW